MSVLSLYATDTGPVEGGSDGGGGGGDSCSGIDGGAPVGRSQGREASRDGYPIGPVYIGPWSRYCGRRCPWPVAERFFCAFPSPTPHHCLLSPLPPSPTTIPLSLATISLLLAGVCTAAVLGQRDSRVRLWGTVIQCDDHGTPDPVISRSSSIIRDSLGESCGRPRWSFHSFGMYTRSRGVHSVLRQSGVASLARSTATRADTSSIRTIPAHPKRSLPPPSPEESTLTRLPRASPPRRLSADRRPYPGDA